MATPGAQIDDIYFAQEEIPRIEPDLLKKLSKLKPWRSFLAIALDWSVIILCIVVCEKVSYWFYPLAFVVAGTRFHGLEAMMHEATHYRLHSNRTINEFIGELSVWPMGLSVFLYRFLRHFSHHKNIGTMKDAHIFQSYKKYPDRFSIPLSPWRLFKNCVAVAVRFPSEVWLGQIYGSAKMLTTLSKSKARLWIGFQSAMLLFIIAGSIVWGLKVLWIYLLFFVLPFMWIAVFSRYLRLLSEHFGIPAEERAVTGAGTRTVIVAWPIRVMLWPHNLNYHLEHHWYPSVPFYNLPALHRHLYASPDIRPQMHITAGLKNLLRELTSVNR
jgi:fatty acid desaturase